jgi:hypothetical protein
MSESSPRNSGRSIEEYADASNSTVVSTAAPSRTPSFTGKTQFNKDLSESASIAQEVSGFETDLKVGHMSRPRVPHSAPPPATRHHG